MWFSPSTKNKDKDKSKNKLVFSSNTNHLFENSSQLMQNSYIFIPFRVIFPHGISLGTWKMVSYLSNQMENRMVPSLGYERTNHSTKAETLPCVRFQIPQGPVLTQVLCTFLYTHVAEGHLQKEESKVAIRRKFNA